MHVHICMFTNRAALKTTVKRTTTTTTTYKKRICLRQTINSAFCRCTNCGRSCRHGAGVTMYDSINRCACMSTYIHTLKDMHMRCMRMFMHAVLMYSGYKIIFIVCLLLAIYKYIIHIHTYIHNRMYTHYIHSLHIHITYMQIYTWTYTHTQLACLAQRPVAI